MLKDFSVVVGGDASTIGNAGETSLPPIVMDMGGADAAVVVMVCSRFGWVWLVQ